MSIFGIGAGKMELQLDRFDFHPGEKLSGIAKLQVNEPLKARGVKVVFWAERPSSKNTTTIIYRREIVLDNSQQYMPNMPKSYNFELEIPVGIIFENNYGQGFFGSIMNLLQSMGNNNIRWFVQAKLDLEMAFDVSATKQIRVTPRPNSGIPGQGTIQN
jgi:hypothetical protein